MDIQARMKDGKGPAYERWAKVFNLKQMAAALQYLQENGLLEYADLEQKAAELTDHFHTLLDSIKSTEVAGFGEGTPQQAIFEISRKGKSQKCASVNTLALLAG